MDPGHKARKNPSDNADLGFQAVDSALRIMQLNVDPHTRRRSRQAEMENRNTAGRFNSSINHVIKQILTVNVVNTRLYGPGAM